jgi:uncharacterized glyoxalase superfamily protein PhnB
LSRSSRPRPGQPELVSQETPSLGALAPPTIGGSPVLLHLEVKDVDAVARRAIDAGAEVEIPVQEFRRQVSGLGD